MSLPSFIPMLCEPIDVLPTDDIFIAEIKFDGWRALLIHDDEPVIKTRSGNTIDSIDYLRNALTALPTGTVLDGEIIDPTKVEGGWNRVQSICSSADIHIPSTGDPALTVMLFDILFYDGTDLRHRPWRERRDILETITLPEGCVLAETFMPSQERLDELLAAGHEGIVVKRINAPYTGGRTGAWAKIKPEADESAEAEIIGFSDGNGKYAGQIGSLQFRLPSGAQGYCSGFDDELRALISGDRDTYIGGIVEVAHWGVTNTGSLRHPTFRRLRPDRSSAEAQVIAVSATPKKKLRTAATAAKKPRMRNYASMKDAKLLACLESFQTQTGDAYDRCMNGGSGEPSADLAVVETLCGERQLV